MDARSTAPDASVPDATGTAGAAAAPLRDVVRDRIRRAIVEGRFRPGERLTEERLAEDFNVSRNPVREALRALAGEGLVTLAAWRGATVRELTREDALELIEIRASLEGLNARHAARRREPDVIARLTEILERGTAAAQAGQFELLPDLNTQFHETLYEGGTNHSLQDMMQVLRARTSLAFRPFATERPWEPWAEHAAILKAIIAGDGPLAEMLMSRHVGNSGAVPEESGAARPAPQRD